MQKGKLFFITNYFGNGGAATVMKIISQKLSDRYDTTIIAFSDDKKIYNLPENVNYMPLKYKFKNSNLKKIERIILLRKIFKKNKNCKIISFEYFVNMQCIISNLFLKNKIIISERNDPKHVGNKRRKTRNFLYNFCDFLVCQTEEAKEYFPKKIQRKTRIIPNPINPNLPEKYNGERKKEIVNFCRFEKQKNIPLLIDAFEIINKKYPDYKLILYGEGKEKENIKKCINEKHLNRNIEICNFDNNIHEKILKCAMFVSSSNYEGISNSMIESMAIGLPTICTDCPCGGARMMIKNNENGILVPINDKYKLANAIEKIIKDKDFAEKISKNGTKIKETINQEKICEKWIELI